MRLQLMRPLRLALALAVLAGPALADPPGATPPIASEPAADAAAPAPPEDPDLRDVLSGPPPEAPPPDPSAGEPMTGTARAGVYSDSDQTTVLRFLGAISQTWGKWQANASLGIDAVTSASVDVRSSPALSKVDVVTSASGRSSTSGGQMTDTRYQLTGGLGWKDSEGHAATVSGAVAKETDYASVSAGINGSYDVLDRTTTLLGGVTVTDSWVSSVLDATLHGKLLATGWSAGVARVLTRDDAVRVRYDGKLSNGDLSSPYRNVRFGDWSATLGRRQITFTNTIGSADGLLERLPEERVGHAAVVEWVHSIVPGVGLHPELRVGHDSWGIDSLTAAIDLRVARPLWRLRTGYRYYTQSGADFFQDKYTMAPTMYVNYTSDKELGPQHGHLLSFDVSWVVSDAERANDRKLRLDLQLAGVHYTYPGFVFLPTRDSVFVSLGLTWEL
jgi:hypothetical protein